MDEREYLEHDVIQIVTSRDVQIDREDFPFRRYPKRDDPDEYEYNTLFKDDFNRPPSYSDARGNLKCAICDLLLLDDLYHVMSRIRCDVSERHGYSAGSITHTVA